MLEYVKIFATQTGNIIKIYIKWKTVEERGSIGWVFD